MAGKWRAVGRGVALTLAAALSGLFAAEPPSPQGQREALMKTYQAGNYKDAYDGLRRLALDPNDDPVQVGKDLETGVNCLQRLGRSDETDEFRETVVEVHKQNWRLLETAAQTLATNEHYGFIIAGKFYRGSHRGGGRYVGTME